MKIRVALCIIFMIRGWPSILIIYSHMHASYRYTHFFAIIIFPEALVSTCIFFHLNRSLEWTSPFHHMQLLEMVCYVLAILPNFIFHPQIFSQTDILFVGTTWNPACCHQVLPIHSAPQISDPAQTPNWLILIMLWEHPQGGDRWKALFVRYWRYVIESTLTYLITYQLGYKVRYKVR